MKYRDPESVLIRKAAINDYPDHPFIDEFIYQGLPVLESLEDAEEQLRIIDYRLNDIDLTVQYNEATVALEELGGENTSEKCCKTAVELAKAKVNAAISRRRLVTQRFLIGEWIINYMKESRN